MHVPKDQAAELKEFIGALLSKIGKLHHLIGELQKGFNDSRAEQCFDRMQHHTAVLFPCFPILHVP